MIYCFFLLSNSRIAILLRPYDPSRPFLAQDVRLISASGSLLLQVLFGVSCIIRERAVPEEAISYSRLSPGVAAHCASLPSRLTLHWVKNLLDSELSSHQHLFHLPLSLRPQQVFSISSKFSMECLCFTSIFTVINLLILSQSSFYITFSTIKICICIIPRSGVYSV